MSSVDAARQQWQDGIRRLESHSSDPEAYRRLLRQLEVATEELRKRLGETFTLAELAEAYGTSDDWLREAVAERIEAPGWQLHHSVVQDAAFHLYARGATDYTP
jgi:DNA-directed RNA polymerase specialized sigma subunit